MFVDDIWCATRRGDLEKVRESIERDGIPKVEEFYDSQSLLTVACEVGQIEIVRFLLEKGYYELDRYAPCAFAALEKGHLEVLRLLFEFGLDYDAQCYSKHDDPLIWVTIDNNQKEALRLCVEYGAKVEEIWYGPDVGGFGYDPALDREDSDPSPLELAANAGRTDLVEIFLERDIPLKGQTAEFYLEKARKNEPLRLKFEAAQRSAREIKHAQSSKEIEYSKLSMGDKPWPNVDANRINEHGDNLLFCLLKQKNKLDEESLEYLEHLAPLTDLSHTNERGEHAWELAERRGEIRAMLYLMDYAGIPIASEKRARLESELRAKEFKEFLRMAAIIIVLLPFIILALLIWGIVSLLLFIKDKIFACFKSKIYCG